MKHNTVIAVCLLSFLPGLGCHTYQSVRTVPPPASPPVVQSPPVEIERPASRQPPGLPSVESVSRHQIERAAELAATLPPPASSFRVVGWQYPAGVDPKRYVWGLERSTLDNSNVWQFVKWCDGDETMVAIRPNEIFRLRAVPLNEWLKTLPKL